MKAHLSVAIILLLAAALRGQPQPQLFALPDTFSKSILLLSAGDGTEEIYVGEKEGIIFRYDVATGRKSKFVDLSSRVDRRGDGGLTSAAFHPAYPDSNYVYLTYTRPGTSTPHAMVAYLSRFSLNENRLVDTSTERILLSEEHPTSRQNFESLAFGPNGYLYLATGDGTGEEDKLRAAQDPLSFKGKILRIDVDRVRPDTAYSIPPDNPFVSARDTLPEIWAMGLRHPWRISFDRLTGDLYIGEKGGALLEEINYEEFPSAGGYNYGWSCRVGGQEFHPDTVRFCGDTATVYTQPLISYATTARTEFKGGSVTGGYVYRGPEEDLRGYYIFADFFADRLFLYEVEQGNQDSIRVITELPTKNIASFGEGNDGTLYAVSYNGTVYRVGVRPEPTTAVRPPVLEARAIYPNPTRGLVNVRLPPALGALQTTELFAPTGMYLGQLAPAERGAAETYRFQLGELPVGVYTLRFRGAAGTAVSRIVLHH